MKKTNALTILLTFVLLISSCKKEDIEMEPEVLQSTSYELQAAGGSNISGTATFTEDSNGTTTILLDLNGSSTAEHPAYIRFNSVEEGGDIAITLTNCTCAISETIVSKLDDNSAIGYDRLVNFNGHITIHESPSDLETIISATNIGSNK